MNHDVTVKHIRYQEEPTAMPKDALPDSPILDAFRYFDDLPEAALVRQPVVEALYSCSSATIRRRVRDGRIPKPHSYSDRLMAWNVGELRQALQASKTSQPSAEVAESSSL